MPLAKAESPKPKAQTSRPEDPHMATILLIAEQSKGHLKKATFHALTAAQQLAQRTSAQVHAVVIGQGIGDAAQALAAAGATVHAVDGAGFAAPLAETHAAAAAAAAKACDASHVVIAATTYGKDIAPRIAARLGAG